MNENADDLLPRGRAHQTAGRLDDAIDCFRRATEADHENGAAMAAWGKALRAAKRKREAVAVLRQACVLLPGDADLCCELGDAWQDLGYPREALPSYARASDLDPGLARAWYGAGCAHLGCGEFATAAECQRVALRLAPGWSAARHNLGSALFKLGQVDDALDAFAEAARGPQPELSLAMSALVVPGSPRADYEKILEVRQQWVRQLPDDSQRTAPKPRRRAQPHGKLRVGYVSSFFQQDHWMKPVWGLINRHDRRAFEIHLFSDAPAAAIKHGYEVHPDDHFHDISALSNDLAAGETARAELDLLVDLNSYSAGARLPLFGRRPAPVIAAWFNLYATSGMPCFDYLIGDAEVIPPAEEKFYTEKILRVPGSYLTFEVNYPVPDVAPAPGREGGGLAFGCLAPLVQDHPAGGGGVERNPPAIAGVHADVKEAPLSARRTTGILSRGRSRHRASRRTGCGWKARRNTTRFWKPMAASTWRSTPFPTTAARPPRRRSGRACRS